MMVLRILGVISLVFYRRHLEAGRRFVAPESFRGASRDKPNKEADLNFNFFTLYAMSIIEWIVRLFLQ
jgi:hypothetical protein